jgi:hypothetical protein
MCQGHYVRAKKTGEEPVTPLKPMTYRDGATVCEVPGCGKDVRGRKWCLKHYKRWRKHGDPEVVTLPRVREGAPAQVYVLLNREYAAGKVGLAAVGSTRLQEHTSRGWEVLWLSPPMPRSVASATEARLLSIVETRGYLTPSMVPQKGWTETFDEVELPAVLAAVA